MLVSSDGGGVGPAAGESAGGFFLFSLGGFFFSMGVVIPGSSGAAGVVSFGSTRGVGFAIHDLRDGIQTWQWGDTTGAD
jgi:hypothetical protein